MACSGFTVKHRGQWTRWRTFRGSASHFFPNAGVLEKDAAFKTSDIFESKVLQWRSETVPWLPQGSLFWRETAPDAGVSFTSKRIVASWFIIVAPLFRVVVEYLAAYQPREMLGNVGRERPSLADPTLLRCSLISGTREPPSSVSYVLTDSRSYLLHGVKACKRPLRSVFHFAGFTRVSTGIKLRSLVDHAIVTG